MEASRRWLRRNRVSIAVGAGLVGAGYLAAQYVVSKVNEARQRMSDDRIAKQNLQRRFIQNQQDCTYTVLALLPTAVENICEKFPVEQVSDELQKQRSERRAAASRLLDSSEPATAPSKAGSVNEDDAASVPSSQPDSYVHGSQVLQQEGKDTTDNTRSESGARKSKAQLWDEMKILSISRAITLIYTLSLLNLLTRIQLNLLGRRNYLSSVVALAAPSHRDRHISLENKDDDNLSNAYSNDFDVNRKYLAFSWWLLHRGSQAIVEQVSSAVEKVFRTVNPRDELTVKDLSGLMLDVRRHMEGSTVEDRRAKDWLPYLLCPRQEEVDVLARTGVLLPGNPSRSVIPPLLRRLLDETSDLLESPIFKEVLTTTLDETFSYLVDRKIAVQAFRMDPAEPLADSARLTAGSSAGTATKLASVLAVFAKQAHAIGNNGSLSTAAGLGGGNEYLGVMESISDLEAFSAVIYSSNFEHEIPGPETGDSGTTEYPIGFPPPPIYPEELENERWKESAANVSQGVAGKSATDDRSADVSKSETGKSGTGDHSLEAAWEKANA